MLISTHKPNVTRARATGMFLDAFRELRYGRLRIVIDFYLPYYLFLVKMETSRKVVDSLYGIDAVTGRLDPYRFDQPMSPETLREVETGYSLPLQISPQEALSKLGEKLRRLLLMENVFKAGGWNLSGELIESFYMPYWVGVYRRGERARLEVIDAVRGRLEGAKVRELVEGWFKNRPPNTVVNT
ncbi:MAG: hypothetical protein J2P41_21215 [Blastocatellia bacterium]|nr:hypothetical protein [Blastocatellia bacterium]